MLAARRCRRFGPEAFFDTARRRKLLELGVDGDIGGSGEVLTWFPALARSVRNGRKLNTAM